VIFLAATLISGFAHASGIDIPSVGTGLSGPTTADAAAIYWNPAMLSRRERGEVLFGTGVVGGRVGYQRDRLGQYQYADTFEFNSPVDPSYIDSTRSGPAEAVSTFPAAPTGDFFLASGPIAKRLVLGVGAYVPYAAPLKFPDDGPQRFALQEAFIAVTQITGAAAVQLQPSLSLGATVSYVGGLGEISRIQDFAGVDPFATALSNPPISQENSFGLDAPATVRELDVLARPFAMTDGLSHGIDFSVGLAVVPSDDLTLGLSYQHGSLLKFVGDFSMNMDDAFFTEDLAAQGLSYPKLVRGEGVLSFRLPNRLTGGVSIAASDKVTVDFTGAWIRWSTLKSFDLLLTSPELAQPDLNVPDSIAATLPRNWTDTVHAETRIAAQTSEKLLVAGTVGYHSPASPDSTIDAASPDGHRLVGGFTSVFDLSDRTALVADSELHGILPRTVTESDFDLGNGTYTMVVGSLLVHLQVALGRSE